MDAQLFDICISTSAAPTYLLAHHFKNQDAEGNVHEFNLIDGGVAANNPVYYIYILLLLLLLLFLLRIYIN